jgi:hypothetical protein
VGGRHFSAEREGGYSFFQPGEKNIDIVGNFGHFVAQKMLK